MATRGGTLGGPSRTEGLNDGLAAAGITMRFPDESVYRLPPELRGIQPAPPGVYRLRSTGEELENPDFLYTWTITYGSPDAG